MDSVVADIDERNGWDRLFREIKLTTAGYDLSYKTARLPENRTRNRYRDVSPFDHSRVKLIEGENDYINASLIEVPDANRKYILAQGPLNHTAGHFWQTVWEQNSAAVIMLNRIIEKGTIKCSQYFPLDEDPMQFTDVGLTVSITRQQVNPNYTVRYLNLQKDDTGEIKAIYQFHYTAWPDFGVPESPAAFLDFLNCVKDSGVLEPNVGPPVIHCSAGIGRSGTFALVDSCLVFIERDIPFDVKETLLEMRKYRMGLIQTAQQLRFSYLAIAEGARAMRDPGGQESTEPSTESEPESPYESSDDEEHNDTGNGDGDVEKEPEDQVDQDKNRKRPAENDFEKHGDEKRGKQEDIESPTDNHIGNTTNVAQVEELQRVEEANNNAANLRKRNISERKEALSNHVNDIKKKMQESEKGNTYSSWLPYIVGGTVLLTVCTVTFYAFYR
uniref:tyrosine-protein phosphatase non-receptor type 2-like n=1 Tax=Styela clava TaxID=7725 RepID=UPI00193A3C21|nr:tyrosine-protein phosphatase non-receptor type 2-like [Styela clava]